MIINHPVLNRFSPSIREVEPTINDDKLLIPNTFDLSGIPPEPLYIAGTSTSVQESSFATGSSMTIANAGGLAAGLCTLRNGWWRIRVAGCYLANYTSVLQGGDFQVQMAGPTQITQLLTLYAIAGAQSFDTSLDVMLPANHGISMFLNTNAVGQSHQTSVHVLCNKLL